MTSSGTACHLVHSIASETGFFRERDLLEPCNFAAVARPKASHTRKRWNGSP